MRLVLDPVVEAGFQRSPIILSPCAARIAARG